MMNQVRAQKATTANLWVLADNRQMNARRRAKDMVECRIIRSTSVLIGKCDDSGDPKYGLSRRSFAPTRDVLNAAVVRSSFWSGGLCDEDMNWPLVTKGRMRHG